MKEKKNGEKMNLLLAFKEAPSEPIREHGRCCCVRNLLVLELSRLRALYCYSQTDKWIFALNAFPLYRKRVLYKVRLCLQIFDSTLLILGFNFLRIKIKYKTNIEMILLHCNCFIYYLQLLKFN